MFFSSIVESSVVIDQVEMKERSPFMWVMNSDVDFGERRESGKRDGPQDWVNVECRIECRVLGGWGV
jgi:hypothetical protein